MAKFDLIPNNKEMEILFVMESPHVNEFEQNIPCVGDTGLRMSEKLFTECSLPFGELLKNGYIGSDKYGIMNSFEFPLGMPTDLNIEQLHYTKLKEVEWIQGISGRINQYEKLKSLLSEAKQTNPILDFKTRIIQYVEDSPKIRCIVFCGFISQAMYLFAFKQEKVPAYNKIERIKTKSRREIYLLFVNHPSEKNAKWDFNLASINPKD